MMRIEINWGKLEEFLNAAKVSSVVTWYFVFYFTCIVLNSHLWLNSFPMLQDRNMVYTRKNQFPTTQKRDMSGQGICSESPDYCEAPQPAFI